MRGKFGLRFSAEFYTCIEFLGLKAEWVHFKGETTQHLHFVTLRNIGKFLTLDKFFTSRAGHICGRALSSMEAKKSRM